MAIFDVSDFGLINQAYDAYALNRASLQALFPRGQNPEADALVEEGVQVRGATGLEAAWFGFDQEVDGDAFQALTEWNTRAAGFIRDWAPTVPGSAATLISLPPLASNLEDPGQAAGQGFTEELEHQAGLWGQAFQDVGAGLRNTVALGKYLPLIAVAAVLIYGYVLYKKGSV